jgi:hypothetical protein
MPKGGPRLGAGRKPIGRSFTFDLPEALAVLIDQEVGEEGRSAFLRKIIKEHFGMKGLLELFIASPDFKAGVVSATRASWGGSGYSVELLPETDSWRVLWNGQIGNRYSSAGEILALPTFTDDGTYEEATNGDNPMSEEEYFDLCFANEEDDLKQEMRDKLALA